MPSKPKPESRKYTIFNPAKTQAARRRLELERERERAAEVLEWHREQRAAVRARNSVDPWRLPEARGEVDV